MELVKEALKELIEGECEAVLKYKLFMTRAEEEGFVNVVFLFKALIIAEEIHIKNHTNALGEDYKPEIVKEHILNSTLENIEISLKNEIEENKKLYPRLIKSIKKELKSEYGKVAKLSMTWAKLVEKEHAKFLKIALKNLKKGVDLDFHTISICQVCGNILINQVPTKECSICGHDAIFFTSINR